MSFLLWPAIFVITVLETLIATWEGRADRQCMRGRRFSVVAANWATSFELVLFVDLYILVKEGWPILIPICAGAWIGKFWACERRRKKFRPRTRRLRKKAARSTLEASQPEGGTSAAPELPR